MMFKARYLLLQSRLVPARVTLWPKKNGALVVVDAVNFPAFCSEMRADFGADEAGRACDQELHHKVLEGLGTKRQ